VTEAQKTQSLLDLARECGAQIGKVTFGDEYTFVRFTEPSLAAFADRIRKDEREKCAKLCEEIDDRCPDCLGHNDHDQCTVPQKWQYAAAIRDMEAA
jgi:hypothetical protein